jgi:hypothetical protein
MPEIRPRLQSMVASLEADPAIRVTRAVISDPLPPETLARTLSNTTRTLPAGVADFYSEVGAFGLEWNHIDEGDEPVRGTAYLLPLTEVLGDWEDVTWFPGEEEYRPVLPFDMFTQEACAAFWEEEDGKLSASIRYHYFGEELYETGYSFGDYLDRLISCRGYWYWPQTLCPELQDSVVVRAFRKNMPGLFSDYDDSLFRPLPDSRQRHRGRAR